jgi:hypothetical protein
MLPYKDLLVCGISTQINQEVLGFDEIINANDIDFIESGLIQKYLPLGICNPEPIRCGFLIRFTL